MAADTLIQAQAFVTDMGDDARGGLNGWLAPFLDELGHKKRGIWAPLRLPS